MIRNMKHDRRRERFRLFRLSMAGIVLAAGLCLGGCAVSDAPFIEQETKNGESAIVEYRCISNAGNEKKLYVVLKNYHGDYWTKMIGGIVKKAKELDATVYLGGIDNETDVSGQISLIDEALEQGADGILLAPANSSALADICREVQEQQVPLVFVDASINTRDFDACYMTDNMDAGKTAAEEMLRLLKEAGNTPAQPLRVGILLSSDTSQSMVNRVSGFLDYWAKHAPARWEIEQNITLNGGNVSKAQSDAAALLKDNETLKGILGCNNTSSIGIAKAILEEKRTDVVMVGFDLADETKQIIRDPEYRAVSLMQRQAQMAELGLQRLYDLTEGKVLEQKYVDTGIIVVDSDYLMENGDS